VLGRIDNSDDRTIGRHQASFEWKARLFAATPENQFTNTSANRINGYERFANAAEVAVERLDHEQFAAIEFRILYCRDDSADDHRNLHTTSQNPDNDKRYVVVLVSGGRKLLNVTHDLVSQRAGPHLAMRQKQLDESSFAEVDAFGLRRMCIDQPIGVKEEKIAALEVKRLALVLLPIEDSH
jgi:hypothetical protein